MTRHFKGDKWTQLYGSPIPVGSQVAVHRFMPRRRVLVDYRGTRYLTMLWCLEK